MSCTWWTFVYVNMSLNKVLTRSWLPGRCGWCSCSGRSRWRTSPWTAGHLSWEETDVITDQIYSPPPLPSQDSSDLLFCFKPKYIAAILNKQKCTLYQKLIGNKRSRAWKRENPRISTLPATVNWKIRSMSLWTRDSFEFFTVERYS